VPRIIGGCFRGRKLVCPKGTVVRPTADMVKEALFGILGSAVEGVLALDLYAGCGSLGLEALSRGARECYLVDRSRACCDLIRRNLERMSLEGRASVMRLDCRRAIRLFSARQMRFGLVLADPPYRKQKNARDEAKKILLALDHYAILARSAIFVLEHFTGDTPGEEFTHLRCEERRRYGDTMLSFYKLKS
jgi:16S rRNA (guanine966-N2)-methyltransferase